MDTICQVCAKPAQYTDGASVYCSQICQITGNLTVLMSSPKWNRDIFIELMNHLRTIDQLKLIDNMLSDANERQRQAIIQWMDELQVGSTITLRTIIDNGLLSLLINRKYSVADLKVVFDYLDNFLKHGWIGLQMFKVLLGKLIQGNYIEKNDLLDFLIAATITIKPNHVQHLYTVGNFADWVKMIVDGYLSSVKVLIDHGVNALYITEYRNPSLIHNLKDAKGVFNDPGKRIKR